MASNHDDVTAAIDRSGLPNVEHPLLETKHRTSFTALQVESGKGRTLSKPLWTTFFVILGDVLLCLTPVLFIGLAAVAISLDNKPVSLYSERVQAVIRVSPTIFPIVYAAITGKLLRAIGLYKAEKGAQLGTLERLIGSQSLFTAVERQYALRGIDVLGFGIIMLWLLSPLGGQSSLRLLEPRPNVVEAVVDLQYLPLQSFAQTYTQGASAPSGEWPIYAPLYMTSLRAARNNMNTSMDLWGNVKVPVLPSPPSPGQNASTWLDVPDTEPVSYTSLLGIPIAGIPAIGNSSFDITSRYWSITCDDFVRMTNTTHPWNQSASANKRSTFAMTTLEPAQPNGNIRFNYTTKWDQSAGRNISTTDCAARAMYVDSRIACFDRNCRVTAMRNTLSPIPNITTERYWVRGIAYSLPGAALGQNQYTVRQSELPEVWMMDPNTNYTVPSFTFADLATLPKEVFSRRLETVINTFWESSFGIEFRMGNLSLATDNTQLFVAGEGGGAPQFPFNATRAHNVRFQGEKYVCRWTFAILTLAISGLLLVAAVASMVLRLVTLAPDVLGYVSSSMTENPYVEGSGASHVDGLERARQLKHVRIRIGDVNFDGDVGHVAVGGVGTAQALRKGRLYD